MSLPKQYEITEQEMWELWRDGNLYDIVTLDHIILAKRYDNDQPVWVRVQN